MAEVRTAAPRPHWPFLALVLVLGLAAYGAIVLALGERFRAIGDGRTFLVTGQRLLEGRASELYAPVEHSAPFTYLPHVAAYFALFSLLGPEVGHHAFLLSNLLALWGSLALLLRRFERGVASRAVLYGLVVLACLPFWFIALEEFYVGNVDFTLLLLVLVQIRLFETGRRVLAGLILGLLVSFKPQMLLLLAQPLLWGDVLPVLAGAGFLVVACATLYAVTGWAWTDFVQHLAGYVTWTRHQGLQVSPVNQSLRSVMRMLFGSEPYPGWFDPIWHRPRELSYHVLPLPPGVVAALTWVVRLVVAALALHRLVAVRRDQAFHVLLVCLALLPTLSPAFWQTHMVYMIPVGVWLIFRLRDEGFPRPETAAYAVSALFVGLGNPAILGGRIADLLHSGGLFLVAVWIQLFLLLRFCPAAARGDYRALAERLGRAVRMRSAGPARPGLR
jgi:hypothetical protein